MEIGDWLRWTSKANGFLDRLVKSKLGPACLKKSVDGIIRMESMMER